MEGYLSKKFDALIVFHAQYLLKGPPLLGPEDNFQIEGPSCLKNAILGSFVAKVRVSN